ncbi:MAG: serine hydrolase [Balneolaceae bacterium]|nr:serine hydrolase [Balneolaceae bacterium]MBO6546555.1 serine hydrolase [Balneolaceae bacterium]MBO6648914.1 serine hydrolase [Balneolaceae bacterium]
MLAGALISCKKSQDLLAHIIKSDPDLNSVAANPDHEVQILYTQIDRDSLNQPTFTTFSYKLDEEEYFYPASTVKFPAVLLALEKMNELDIPADARMEIDSSYSRQSEVKVDSTAPNLEPSVAHYSKKIMLVSDNDAFNRLYEFIGQDELNANLQEKGYTDTRLLHRLSIALSKEENAHTNPIRLYEADQLLYEQDMKVGTGNYESPTPIKKGVGYNSGGELINESFDFTAKNFFPLDEQHEMIKAFIFPEKFPAKAFDLRPEDRKLVLKYSSILPRESEIEVYQDTAQYWDSYAKFVIYGSEPGVRMPGNIRIFNKIGLAYGYTIDNAYIMDEEKGIEFFLSVVIHTNANQIFNDNNYEYDEIAFPFMAKLGQAIYKLELKRPKTHPPSFDDILTY